MTEPFHGYGTDALTLASRALSGHNRRVPLKAEDLETWARYEGRDQLPELVGRLIHETIDPRALTRADMPSGMGVGKPGVDGHVVTHEGNSWVPEGTSVWEMGCDLDYAEKAQSDYSKRTATPSPGIDSAQTTFVFVTPWLWTKKPQTREAWERKRRKDGPWKDVRVHDADALLAWLRTAPAATTWFAEVLGRPGPLRTLEWSWREWSRATIPTSSERLVLAGRSEQRDALLEWLNGPPDTLAIHAGESGEVAAFCWAALGRLPEQARKRHRERALVVLGDDDLQHIMLERRPQLLIARDCSYEAARHAASVGHHVLLANSIRSRRDALILGSLEPQWAQLELEYMRCPQDPHELIKRLRGTQPGDPGVPMTAIRRALRGRDDELPAELAPLCLVGGWTDREEDLAAVCGILGEDSAFLRELLRQHGSGPTSALVHGGVGVDARWRWRSRLDAWHQLEPHLGSEALTRFERAIVEVLGGTLRCSTELRHGLLEGLALLAVEVHPTRPEHERQLPERVVGRLLYPPRVAAWAELAGALPILAEAAPDKLLECAEHFVGEQLGAVATDDGARAIACVCEALELLAWVERHLFRVTELLAKIADTDAAAPSSGRARQALRYIYLPWSPGTTASLEARGGVIDWLVGEHPELAIDLMLELLSTRTRHAHPRPRYQDWAQDKREVTRADANDAYVAIWRRLLRLARVDATRWLLVFPQLHRLALNQQRRAEATTAIAQLDAAQLDADQREQLRQQLRATIHKHRTFNDAGWSLPEAQLEQLEQLHDRLAPERLQDELAWIFSNAPLLLHPRPGEFHDQQTALAAHLEAAARLAERLTPGELVIFASRVSSPWALGHALASLDDTDTRALALLRASLEVPADASQEAFRRGLGHALFRRREDFRAWSSDTIEAVPAEVKAELLLGCPSQPQTWDFAESLGPAVTKAYWQRAAALYPHDRGDLGRVIHSLVAVGRIEDATRLLASARATGVGSLDSQLVVSLLDGTLGNKVVDEHVDGMDSFLITALLKQLRAEGERWHDELLRFEWIALPILDIHHGDEPLTHYAELVRRPDFFVQMVHLADSWTEQTRADSERAWTLLEHWRGLPGRHDGDAVDAEQLRDWITRARALLRNTELSIEGARRLGAVLANAPKGADGIWPHEAVRQVIETLGDAPHLRQSLVNTRGNRWSDDGLVDIERDLARSEQLRQHATALRVRHPRTARVLEDLARRSECDAAYWANFPGYSTDWTPRISNEVRVDRALDGFEADGRLVFDLDTLRAEVGEPIDLYLVLGRHRRVAHIDGNLYVIVRPTYQRDGAPPPSWYLDELMSRSQTAYCVGLLSAAALHGAADQQPQVVQVLVDRPRDNLKVGAHTIVFIHRERAQPFAVVRMDTETGTMAVATPEATVFDLSESAEPCDVCDVVITVLEEFAENVDAERLLIVASTYPPAVVELAAILIDEAGHEELARSLRATPIQHAPG